MIVFNQINMSDIFRLLSYSFLILFSATNTSYAQNVSAAKDSDVLAPVITQDSYQILEKEEVSVLTKDNSKHDFIVEVARTAEEQNKGLMFRTTVPEKTGMLFLFEGEKLRSFWMKNTQISLDIIFIKKNGLIHHIHPNAKINTLDPISSTGGVSAVLEIAAGEAERLGIKIGDSILHNAFSQ